MRCALTPPSYSMEEHYRKYHGEMSAKLKGEVALAVHEREDTLQLRGKQRKVKPTRPTRAKSKGAAVEGRRRRVRAMPQARSGWAGEHHL